MYTKIQKEMQGQNRQHFCVFGEGCNIQAATQQQQQHQQQSSIFFSCCISMILFKLMQNRDKPTKPIWLKFFFLCLLYRREHPAEAV